MRDWTKKADDVPAVSHCPTRAQEDVELLRTVLANRLEDEQHEAFSSMLEELVEGRRERLSGKQRSWVRDVLEEHIPQYENLVSSGKVPRGREVETPPALRNLPKRPPSKPRLDDE